ncbi:hypothetical protein PC116_g4249 [Phytophthora cactorum]|uniref:Uncharacterized protein n=1 Tax=Phytophthora cactorum TaxID=29920 RepID=A0A329RCG9_9STRA|nr:hypothetical protein Pcac1_g24926 [Phytophthora cactorum]KAG2862249.1 hypothetical protein PC113_g6477 [Phytophthora cactorum]KAG2980027.1 hypothetical protein PC118_g11408 [Phytophthora cactorum]KAG3017234.1 hypothetical protein PC120_g11102 [Phytophthora cactorum]KAG3063341.1 hypothetical protein PC121_g12229 [Phytophthora cactorum]
MALPLEVISAAGVTTTKMKILNTVWKSRFARTSIEENEVMNYEFDFPDYNLDVDSSYHGDMNLDFELVDDTLLDLVCQHQLDEEAKETSEAQTFSANSLRGPTTMYLDDLFDTCLEQNSSGRVITSVAEHGV